MYAVLQTALTALISACALFIIAKLLGYRQISQMSVFDYINGITIGSIAAELATGGWDGIPDGLTALAVYGAVTVILSLVTDISPRLRNLITGKPLLLFYDGKFMRENFGKARLDLHEFLAGCRAAGYFSLTEIGCVMLEANGRLSILPRADNRPATPSDLGITVTASAPEADIILDGQVNGESLAYIGRDTEWLAGELATSGRSGISGIFLATAAPGGRLNIFPATTGSGEEKEL